MAVLLLILIQLLLHLPLQHVPVAELQHFDVLLPRVTCIDRRSPCRSAVQGRWRPMLRRVEGGRQRVILNQLRDFVQLLVC